MSITIKNDKHIEFMREAGKINAQVLEFILSLAFLQKSLIK